MATDILTFISKEAWLPPPITGTELPIIRIPRLRQPHGPTLETKLQSGDSVTRELYKLQFLNSIQTDRQGSIWVADRNFCSSCRNGSYRILYKKKYTKSIINNILICVPTGTRITYCKSKKKNFCGKVPQYVLS